MNKLQETLRALAVLRVAKATAEELVANRAAILHESEPWLAHEAAKSTLREIENALSDATRAARDAVMEQFQATGDKNPCPGVQIKNYKRWVYDRGQVIAWAWEHQPDCIELNTSLFEKNAANYLSEGKEVPAHLEYDQRATLASDLSAYLP